MCFVAALEALKRIELSCLVLFENLHDLRGEIVEIIAKIRLFIESDEAEKYRLRHKNAANFVGGLRYEVCLLEKKLGESVDPSHRLLSLQSKFIVKMGEVIDALGGFDEVIYFRL